MKNKIIYIIVLLLIFLYMFNTNIKLLINTNYNKYSNILESNIVKLHNKLLDESNYFI